MEARPAASFTPHRGVGLLHPAAGQTFSQMLAVIAAALVMCVLLTGITGRGAAARNSQDLWIGLFR